MRRITVLIAEDDEGAREELRRMLEAERNLRVVGEAQDGRQAVALAKKLRPDVVLMDLAMPRLNGLEATRLVLKALPATKVLILSAHADDAYIKGATESDPVGFLLKQTSADDVLRAIQEVQKGKGRFRSSSSKRLHHGKVESRRAAGPRNRKIAHLTAREVEVLRLIAEGNANKETAAKLGIGIKTVEKHREHLMQKLGIHETAGLTRYAMAAGIIKSPSRSA